MYRDNRTFAVLLIDQHRNFDFAGGNHAYIDAGFIQRFEHLRSNARIGLHASANDGDFADVFLNIDIFGMKKFFVFFQAADGIFQLIVRNRKADIFGVITSDGLQNDIHVDFVLCQNIEQTESNARFIRNT